MAPSTLSRCTSSAQLWDLLQDQLLQTDRKLLPRSSVAAECHRLVLLDTVSNRPTPRSQSGLVPPQYTNMFVVPPLPSGTRAQRSGVRVCLPRSSIRPPNRDDDVIVISVRFGHIVFPKPNRYHPDFGSVCSLALISVRFAVLFLLNTPTCSLSRRCPPAHVPSAPASESVSS